MKSCGIVATGRETEMGAIPKEEEWRKTLPSVLLRSPTLVAFDNLLWTLRSATLARSLTSDRVSDRGLGTVEDVVVGVRTTWGHHREQHRLHRDLLSRSYRIRLNAKMADSEKRAGFLYPDL